MAIIVAHVHPSGDPTPSPDDLHLTRQLTAAGSLLGVELLDHIIVGDGRYVSFREIGRCDDLLAPSSPTRGERSTRRPNSHVNSESADV